MNDKTKAAPAAAPAAATDTATDTATDAKPKLFAVTKAFWLGEKLCAEGQKVQLTDSQAKRAGDAVQAAA